MASIGAAPWLLLTSVSILAAGCDCASDTVRTECRADAGAHRAAAPLCERNRPASRTDAGVFVANAECNVDADCTRGLNGRCFMGNGLISAPRLQCSYDACLSDGDCAQGFVCTCQPRGPLDQGFVGHQCVAANCATDTDCLAGCCAPSRAFCSTEAKTGFFCRTNLDQCQTDADCVADGGVSPHDGFCAFNPSLERWVCARGYCQP